MEVLGYLEEFSVLYFLRGAHNYTVSVIIIEYKQLFVTLVGGDKGPAGEVGFNALLWVNDIGDDCVGAHLQWFQKSLLW